MAAVMTFCPTASAHAPSLQSIGEAEKLTSPSRKNPTNDAASTVYGTVAV